MDGQDNDGAVRAGIAQLLPELRAAARLLAASRAEADDLVQEAVLRMLRGAGGFAPPPDAPDTAAALRAWGVAVLRNVFREGWRRRRAEQARLALEPAPEEGRAGGQEGRDEIRDLSRALAALPPALREALVLVGAQGLSHEQAAAICAVPVGTIRARVSRARRQLARLLGPGLAGT